MLRLIFEYECEDDFFHSIASAKHSKQLYKVFTEIQKYHKFEDGKGNKIDGYISLSGYDTYVPNIHVKTPPTDKEEEEANKNGNYNCFGKCKIYSMKEIYVKTDYQTINYIRLYSKHFICN